MCVQQLTNEETPASIAELPAPELTLPTNGVDCQWDEAGALAAINFGDLKRASQKLPTKDQLYLPYRLCPYRINTAQEDIIYQGSALASLLTTYEDQH